MSHIESDDITTISINDAAEELGVTPESVSQLIRREAIPAEKVGRKWQIEQSIIDAIKDLRDKHGRHWTRHAPWNGGASFVKNDNDNDDDQDKEIIERQLNGKLLKLSREYREAGLYDQALKLQDMVLEQYDFT